MKGRRVLPMGSLAALVLAVSRAGGGEEPWRASEQPELKAALEAWVDPFKGMGM